MIDRSLHHRTGRPTAARSALGLTMLALVGGLLTGCQSAAASDTAAFHQPVTVTKAGDGSPARLTLTAFGASQLGLTVAPVEADPKGGLQAPYSSLLYKADGTTWVYTNPAKLVYVRAAVTVQRVEGASMHLTDGPAPGSLVVVTGAADLFGAEFDTAH
jgi:hypothetical protein